MTNTYIFIPTTTRLTRVHTTHLCSNGKWSNRYQDCRLYHISSLQYTHYELLRTNETNEISRKYSQVHSCQCDLHGTNNGINRTRQEKYKNGMVNVAESYVVCAASGRPQNRETHQLQKYMLLLTRRYNQTFSTHRFYEKTYEILNKIDTGTKLDKKGIKSSRSS